jgi:hypothetical protein
MSEFDRIKEDIIPMFGEITEDHVDACIKGAILADRQKRWISVEDRLPEILKPVLFVSNDEVWDGALIPDRWVSSNGYEFFDVTHWMPLPEPPKTEE